LNVLKVEMIFNLMINVRIFFNFITTMLINHIFNTHSNRFLKKIYIYIYIYIYFLFLKLSKLVQVGELLNILHFQHDVALKCTCKFLTSKYYNRIHQSFNGKIF